MDQVRDCKRLHAKGMGIRAISRELSVSRNTVRGYLRGDRLPGEYRCPDGRKEPVADKFRKQVRDMIVAERVAETPRKQRLTAARIFRLLGKEASYTTIRRIVKSVKLELQDPLEKAFLTLAYDPGVDVQVDFFEAEYQLNDGGREKIFILLVRACFSRRTFAYAAPNQTSEALLEGLMQAFEFFGGVFPTIWFDNLTPAVKKVLKGRSRVMQETFSRFAAHYGFQPEFCAPGKGNEKGGVENQVKYSRHEIFSPIPTVNDRAELQALCNNWMVMDFERRPEGSTSTIGELWSLETEHLIALPATRFIAGRISRTKVSPRSWISVATNHYSVPVEWVGHEVTVRLEAERVVIIHDKFPETIHRRRDGRNKMALELDHYLPLLHRKCRGIDRSVVYRQWIADAPKEWSSYLGILRRRNGEVSGSREFIDTLLLCREWDESEVSAAVKEALGHPETSLATVRYFLRLRHESRQPKIESISYDGPAVLERQASDYMALCSGASR